MRVETLSLGDLRPPLSDAYAYWAELAGDAVGPSWQDFDLMRIPTRLLPTTMVIDVHQPIEQSTFRFWGTGMTKVYGVDMTGRHPIELIPARVGALVVDGHRQTVQERVPVVNRFVFNDIDDYMLTQTLLRFPLSNDGHEVLHIVGCVDFNGDIDRFQELFESDAETTDGS